LLEGFLGLAELESPALKHRSNQKCGTTLRVVNDRLQEPHHVVS
jgi:hypothetical protein